MPIPLLSPSFYLVTRVPPCLRSLHCRLFVYLYCVLDPPTGLYFLSFDPVCHWLHGGELSYWEVEVESGPSRIWIRLFQGAPQLGGGALGRAVGEVEDYHDLSTPVHIEAAVHGEE